MPNYPPTYFTAVQSILARVKQIYVPTLTSHIGTSNAEENVEPPLIECFPAGDTYSKSGKKTFGSYWNTDADPSTITDPSQFQDDGPSPDSIYSNLATFRIECWNKRDADSTEGEIGDFNATLYLRDMFLQAMRDLGFGTAYVSSGSWVADRVVDEGTVYRMVISIDCPVAPDPRLLPPPVTTTIATVQQNTGMVDPDGTNDQGGIPAP